MSSSSPSNTSNDYKPTSYQSLVEDYYEQKHPRDVAQNQFDSNMPVITQADDKGNLQAASSKKEGSSETKAHVLHHHAHPGPVIPEKMDKPLSKEELKKKAEELNE